MALTNYSESDRLGAFLILQEAEQGRPVEFMAQQLASLISAGGGDPVEELITMIGDVCKRVSDLLEDDGAKIWRHLVPMGGQGDPLPYRILKDVTT